MIDNGFPYSLNHQEAEEIFAFHNGLPEGYVSRYIQDNPHAFERFHYALNQAYLRGTRDASALLWSPSDSVEAYRVQQVDNFRSNMRSPHA